MKKILFLILFLTGLTPVFKNNTLNLSCYQSHGQESPNGLEDVFVCSPGTKVTSEDMGDYYLETTCSWVNEGGVATNDCEWGDCTTALKDKPDPDNPSPGSGGGGGGSTPSPVSSKPCSGDPIKNPQITSSGASGKKGGTYGFTRNGGTKFHEGLDISASVNTQLYAMHGGVVTAIRNSFSPGQYAKSSYGNYVTIKSTINGQIVYLKYNHLNTVNVTVGFNVSAGVIIGMTGNTGNAATSGVTPHIHIQAFDSNMIKQNPMQYLKTTFDSNYNSINNCN